MRRRVAQKWRPALTLVLAGTLAAVLALPLLGIGYFRVAGNVLGWGETSWLIGWIAVSATAILAFLLWRLVLRPVQALTAYARATARGTDNATPPAHFGTPELSELAEAVISMGATLQGREAAIRTYADHVTHELKSPLTVIQGAAELLDDEGLSKADKNKMLAARAAEPMPEGQCLLSEIAPSDTDVFVDKDGIVPLPKDALDIILTHLIGNARLHGATEVRLKLAGDVLSITDNGAGISEGNRSRIFDPFFTTRRDTGGTGMGLALVRRVVEAQGAQIELRAGAKTAFDIYF